MPASTKIPPSGMRRAIKRYKPVKRAAAPYTALNFDTISAHAQDLADHIEAHFEELAHVLLEYESYEVVVDEISRTLDLLRNLKENKKYFQLRIGEVAVFLPRNQPLYAFMCFVIVPSLMASRVHFRIPHSTRHFFPKMLALLQVRDRYPNINVSLATRVEFLRERTAVRLNPKTQETRPVTDAVIFTGTPAHADQLRLIFDKRTLFIANGAGHNPIVVAGDADITKAVAATLKLQLYNQGQDCAAPNAVLVHKSVFPVFLHQLREGLRTVGVGDYRDRQCRVGPISDPADLMRIQAFLIEHRRWLDQTTPGIIRASTATLEPTIIAKSLKEGGNFQEIFAPVIFLQEYEKDADLALYFENPRYAPNAMYLTLCGTSGYIKNIIGRSVAGKVLHDTSSFLHDTHLHAPGVERGTQPYGGNGYGASSLSIDGKIMCGATLPQRDIHNWIVRPLVRRPLAAFKAKLPAYTQVTHKDIRKLLRIKSTQDFMLDVQAIPQAAYVDMLALSASRRRYVKLDRRHAFQVLEAPNARYISTLEPRDLSAIRALRGLLLGERTVTAEEFTTRLYALAAESSVKKSDRQFQQLRFFHHIYQLLFGRKSGPRLNQFLLEADKKRICELLDV